MKVKGRNSKISSNVDGSCENVKCVLSHSDVINAVSHLKNGKSEQLYSYCFKYKILDWVILIKEGSALCFILTIWFQRRDVHNAVYL